MLCYGKQVEILKKNLSCFLYELKFKVEFCSVVLSAAEAESRVANISL